MANCASEIIGVKKIALYINNGARFERPDTSAENEVNLIVTESENFLLTDVKSLMKWERVVSFSGNYKQNYFDEFSFLLHGVQNDIPELIKTLRSNRLGYIIEIITTGNKSFVFPSPVFLNQNNTKQIDSHSWNISLSYRIPSFLNKLTLLAVIGSQPEEIVNNAEIIGVQSISLYPNSGIQLVRPDPAIENEVNLIADGEDSYTISDPVLLPKWERIVGYSDSYKQNYLDEFTFLVSGIENETPSIIQDLRNNRVGYIVEIITTGNQSYVFQSPVFLNKANTKQIDSHSWEVSLSYRIPSFLDKLIKLETVLSSESSLITTDIEIIGVQRMALYINKDVRYSYPDASIENEVDLIAHATGSFVINEVKELPKWERTITYSENYRQNYNDEFSFLLHGIENDVPEIIQSLRNNRLGYIVEIITTGSKSFVFPAPVFLNEDNTKQIDSHSWSISLSYRTPSFEDKLIKLNTILMVQSYILVGDNQILGDGAGRAIVAN